jgi:hypothetical protein
MIKTGKTRVAGMKELKVKKGPTEVMTETLKSNWQGQVLK